MKEANLILRDDRSHLQHLMRQGDEMYANMEKADDVIYEIEKQVFIRKCLLYVIAVLLFVVDFLAIIRKLMSL